MSVVEEAYDILGMAHYRNTYVHIDFHMEMFLCYVRCSQCYLLTFLLP